MAARSSLIIALAAVFWLWPVSGTSAMGFCVGIGTHIVLVPGSAGPGSAKTQITNVCSPYGVVTSGESLIYTIGALALSTMPRVAQQPIDLLEAEIGGTTCLNSVSTYPTYDALGYDSRRTKNAYVLSCGHNSINSGRTPTQAYADIIALVDLAQATGFSERLVYTLSDSVNLASTESLRAELNGYITGGAVANSYTVLDVAADAHLGCNGCYSNTTYFDVDGIHYSATGKAIKAALLNSSLQSLGYK